MKCHLTTLTLFVVLGVAEAQGTVGRVSYIEPSAGLTVTVAEKDPHRIFTGFVEVIDEALHKACNPSYPAHCRRFEFSVPFVDEGEAKKLERALSQAWNRYDARTTWRIQTALDGFLGRTLYCDLGLTYDAYIGAWDDELLRRIDAGEFCDDLDTGAQLYTINTCALIDTSTNWSEVFRVYTKELEYAIAHYYPDYIKDVTDAIITYAPGSIVWDGLFTNAPGAPSGLVWSPVATGWLAFRPQQYLDLAQRSLKIDARGPFYLLERYPMLDLLGDLGAQITDVVQKLPTDPDRAGAPGIEGLETLKRSLADRETIFSRSLQWAMPKWLGGAGPEPQGRTGAATREEMAGVGHTSAIGIQTNWDLELSPRVPLFWRWCFNEALSYLPTPFPVPLPVVHFLNRATTLWQSVPEGYSILGVHGDPQFYIAF